jgi:PAS domain S-box-containing protein
LSGAVEHAVEGVVITDLKGDIQYVNPAFEHITGYTRQEVMGKNPSIVKSGIHDKNFYEEMWTCILSGNTWKSEYVNKRKNGSLYNAYASISPIKIRNGKIINFVGVSIDITERKLSQEAIAKKMEELSHSHKMLEQFAADVSLKIDSFTQLLEKQFKDKLDTDTSGFFKFTINGISGVQELIKDLLIFSRLSTFLESLKPTDSGKVFKDVSSNMKETIKDNNAVITCDSLPTVMADEDRLAELFKNLIINAIKYCDKETPRVHVSVKERKRPSAVSVREPSIRTLQTEKEWVFSVADNGMGIDKQFYKHIFKHFKRLNVEGYHPGTGIGLSICKEIVEQFGGNIWVESKLGKETIFYFTIPVMQ